MASRYGFLRRPLWLGAIALALTGFVVFALLGVWQLSRLEERRERNERIRIAQEAAPVELSVLLAETDDLAELEWRRVVVTGSYLLEGEAVLVGRSHKSQAGNNLLTPLELSSGAVIVVNRGWIPFELDDPPIAAAAPPSGDVEVSGTLRPDEGAGLLGGGDGEFSERLGSIDLDRFAGAAEIGTVLPLYLHLESREPSQGELPEPVPLPDLSEGPHLAYAVQWFLFAGIVLIGFPVLVWRTARRRTPSTPSSAP